MLKLLLLQTSLCNVYFLLLILNFFLIFFPLIIFSFRLFILVFKIRAENLLKSLGFSISISFYCNYWFYHPMTADEAFNYPMNYSNYSPHFFNWTSLSLNLLIFYLFLIKMYLIFIKILLFVSMLNETCL